MEALHKTIIGNLAEQDLLLALDLALFTILFKVFAFLKNRLEYDGQLVIKPTSAKKK